MPLDVAAQAVASLRDDRPPLNDEDTAPLVLSPGVSGTTRKAFVGIWLGGRQIGQFDADSAAQHAL
jgi:hypothetical protein